MVSRFTTLLFAALCVIFAAVDASGSSSIKLHRRAADVKLRKAHHGSSIDPDAQGRDLYWFANFTAGVAKDLHLLIDTGSTDVLINPGLYKPSKRSKPYTGKKRFETSYEGVNKKGTGTETVHGKVVEDVLSSGGLTAHNQAIGNITTFKVSGARMKKKAIPFDGIVGFINKKVSGFKPEAQSWFYNLCHQKVISECRFGLAFGTNNKGLQVIGEVDKKLFKDELTVAPLHTEAFPLWTTRADVTLNNKIFLKNQTIIMDSGTSNIQAPSDAARKIFDTLGYPYYRSGGSPDPFENGKKIYFLTAFFPCNKPPTLGFSFPAEADLQSTPKDKKISKTSKNFNIFTSEWSVKDNGNNNCTAVLAGTNSFSYPQYGLSAWLVGQPFYQGHYVDHHAAIGLGYADLKNPMNVGG